MINSASTRCKIRPKTSNSKFEIVTEFVHRIWIQISKSNVQVPGVQLVFLVKFNPKIAENVISNQIRMNSSELTVWRVNVV